MDVVKISRQVRRQRERLAAKGQTDVRPLRTYLPPRLFPRSKYRPHLGAKQRAKGLAKLGLPLAA